MAFSWRKNTQRLEQKETNEKRKNFRLIDLSRKKTFFSDFFCSFRAGEVAESMDDNINDMNN